MYKRVLIYPLRKNISISKYYRESFNLFVIKKTWIDRYRNRDRRLQKKVDAGITQFL